MNHDSQTREWILRWEKANTALNIIRINELRNKNYYLNNREILNGMLQYAYEKRMDRLDSGLVTLQSIFKRIYSQGMNKSQ